MSLGARLLRLRRISGLSLRELAVMAGVSAQAISKYERDLLVPRPEVRSRLATALGVPLEQLSPEPAEGLGALASAPGLEPLACRRFAGLVGRDKAAVLAAAQELLEQHLTLEQMLGEQPEWAPPPGWPKSIRQMRDVERASTELRDAWGLGIAPLHSVVATLEFQGLRVLGFPGPAEFDACCLRVHGRRFVLAVNTAAAGPAGTPAPAQRLALLHALSHALLRVWPDIDAEQAGDRMARALLISATRAHAELGTRRERLYIEELRHLGQLYGVTMAAWVERALDLEIIRGEEGARLQRSFRRRGWLTREPGEHPGPEQPTRLDRLAAKAKDAGILSAGQLNSMLARSRTRSKGRA